MQLLGKAMTPEFWKEVREKDCWRRFREDLFDLWNKYCENRPIEALRYSDYKLFWVTGDRKIYEETYFARRHALNCSCLLALIYPEGDGRTKMKLLRYKLRDFYTFGIGVLLLCGVFVLRKFGL